jgi:Uma2 family endonuclease
MTAPARRRATYDDVLAAPPNMVAEVVFGTLHTHPRPAIRHAIAGTRLGNVLGRAFDSDGDGPGGWLLIDEPELHLGAEPDILVPDIAGWRSERFEAVPEDAKWIGVAPDWVCEVLSPSTAALDRGEKMAVYLRERVRHVWLIDPVAQTLEVYRHGGEAWSRVSVSQGDARVRAEPFDAIAIELWRLWRR